MGTTPYVGDDPGRKGTEMGQARRSRARWPRRAAATILTPAIVTPLVSAGLFAEAAGASSTKTVTVDVPGARCKVTMTRTHPFRSDPKSGQARTTVTAEFGDLSACRSGSEIGGFASVVANWKGTDGQMHQLTSTGWPSATVIVSDIASNFTSRHTALLGGCECFSEEVTLTK
jgi:hypothetical protein